LIYLSLIADMGRLRAGRAEPAYATQSLSFQWFGAIGSKSSKT
jgi:hypothetical protein